jgi:hypothetical protein
MKKTIATLSMMALLLGATSVFAAQAKPQKQMTPAPTAAASTPAATKSKGKAKHKRHIKAKAAEKTSGK